MNVKNKKIIIGSGFIAKKFNKYYKYLKKSKLVIYAAGISNSSEKNKKNLAKEVNRILNFCKFNDKRIIYISTYSISDTSRLSKKYVKNKIKIEKIIKTKSKRYLIIRLPEITGHNKNHRTLTNYFYDKILHDKFFILFKNTKRNVLDIDDAIKNCVKVIKLFSKKNTTINLLNRQFYSPLKIVKSFEEILNKKAFYKEIKIKNVRWSLSNNFYFKTDKKYLNKILKKYYT